MFKAVVNCNRVAAPRAWTFFILKLFQIPLQQPLAICIFKSLAIETALPFMILLLVMTYSKVSMQLHTKLLTFSLFMHPVVKFTCLKCSPSPLRSFETIFIHEKQRVVTVNNNLRFYREFTQQFFKRYSIHIELIMVGINLYS